MSTNYVSSFIMGGLGNQLFQVAVALVYAWKHGTHTPIFSDRPEYRLGEKLEYNKTIFRHLTWVSEVEFNVLGFEKYRESHFQFSPIPYLPTSLLLEGYFQSWKYLDEFKPRLIKELMALTPEDEDVLNRAWKTINPTGKHVLALHVRRGDYESKQYYHTLIPLSYYERAIKHFSDTLAGVEYVTCVFSDDLDWCKTQPLFSGYQFWASDVPYIDLLLMSKCHSLIMANSSYSWWAAYISNSNQVVYPNKWFGPGLAHTDVRDMYPPDWLRIDF